MPGAPQQFMGSIHVPSLEVFPKHIQMEEREKPFETCNPTNNFGMRLLRLAPVLAIRGRRGDTASVE